MRSRKFSLAANHRKPYNDGTNRSRRLRLRRFRSRAIRAHLSPRTRRGNGKWEGLACPEDLSTRRCETSSAETGYLPRPLSKESRKNPPLSPPRSHSAEAREQAHMKSFPSSSLLSRNCLRTIDDLWPRKGPRC